MFSQKRYLKTVCLQPLNQTGKEPNSSKDTAETSKNTVSTSDNEPKITVNQKVSIENDDQEQLTVPESYPKKGNTIRYL